MTTALQRFYQIFHSVLPMLHFADIVCSYRWLGHTGYTELNAFHPDYKPEREHFEWNKRHQTFPRVWYARDESTLLDFVRKNAQSRMVCYGINPRPAIFRNSRGYGRAARDSEIQVSQNLILDFDFEGKPANQQQELLKGFLHRVEEYTSRIRASSHLPRRLPARDITSCVPTPPSTSGRLQTSQIGYENSETSWRRPIGTSWITWK